MPFKRETIKMQLSSIKCLFILNLISSPFVLTEDEFPNEIPRMTSGSCLAAGLCCSGRDSSCVVQRAPPNSIIEDLDDIPCYCDAGCVALNDCCSDFKTACGAADCKVSEWGIWSVCSVECGLGTMVRTRTIQIEPKNGGKACPALIQTRGCRGTRCRRHHINRSTIEDTAVLLPIEFRDRRRVNDSSDITRNLRLRYPSDPDKEKATSYCVEFKVIRSTRACGFLERFKLLREESRVCVVCEKEAQKSYANYQCSGTGTINGLTRFSSLREPSCYGKWKHVSLSSSGSCSCGDAGPDFIFV